MKNPSTSVFMPTSRQKCHKAEYNLKNRILTAQKPILLQVSWKSQTENYRKQQYFQTIILQLLLILLLIICVKLCRMKMFPSIK